MCKRLSTSSTSADLPIVLTFRLPESLFVDLSCRKPWLLSLSTRLWPLRKIGSSWSEFSCRNILKLMSFAGSWRSFFRRVLRCSTDQGYVIFFPSQVATMTDPFRRRKSKLMTVRWRSSVPAKSYATSWTLRTSNKIDWHYSSVGRR